MCVSCRRRALRAAHAPKSSSGGFIWRHFARRFREAYQASCPWDGVCFLYPKRTGARALGARLPAAPENARCVDRLRTLGDLEEVRTRIDRMFRNRVHRAAGIDLGRVVCWWEYLASDESLERRTRELCGRGA